MALAGVKMACWLVLKRRCVCAGGRIRPDCCSGWRTRSAVGRQTRRCPSVRSRCRVSATKEMTCRRVRQRVDHLFSAVGPADATLSGDKKTPTILDRSSGQVYDIKVPTTFLPHTGFAGAWTPATHAEFLSQILMRSSSANPYAEFLSQNDSRPSSGPFLGRFRAVSVHRGACYLD